MSLHVCVRESVKERKECERRRELIFFSVSPFFQSTLFKILSKLLMNIKFIIISRYSKYFLELST